MPSNPPKSFRAKTGWVVSFCLLGVIFYQFYRLAKKPSETILEVPQIITREIVKEGPKEAAKEAPPPPVREIPAVKAVDKPIPPEYVSGYQFAQDWNSAVLAEAPADPLRGLTTFSITVTVADSLSSVVSADDIKTKIEAELRRIGVTIVDRGSDSLDYSLDATAPDSAQFIGFAGQLRVTESTNLPRPVTFVTTKVTIWSNGNVGFTGPDHYRDLAQDYEGPLAAFLSDYLKANPPSP